MSPDALPAGGGNISGGKEMSKEEMFNFLNTDDGTETEKIDLDDKPKSKIDQEDKEEKKPRKEKASKDSDEDEDDIEDEDDDDEEDKEDEEDDLDELLDEDEPTEDKLESMTPPRRKEILKAYPKLFKEFPYLERAYYREQQFTKYFPDPQDAKDAIDKATTLDNFERDLMDGNIKPVLMAVKDDPKTFNKIINGYMNTLREVDSNAYHHVLTNITKQTIRAMLQEAKDSDQEILKSAAIVVHQFMFGTNKWTDPTDLDTGDDKKDSREDKVSQRERAMISREFNRSKSELDGRVNSAYKNTIEAHIDPKNQMSEYVKKTAVRAASETLQSAIESDSRFKSIVDKLWQKHIESDFSKESLDKIRSAFISKARTLLPSVIKKARIDALRGIGKRVRDDSDKDDNPKERSSKRESRSPDNDGQRKSSNGKIPAGMSTLDYLMSED